MPLTFDVPSVIGNTLDTFDERQDHEERVRAHAHLHFGRGVLLVIWQIGDGEPFARLNFEPGPRLELRVFGYAVYHVQPHQLFVYHRFQVVLRVDVIGDVESRLLVHLSYGTVRGILVFVYFALGEAPARFTTVALN